MRAQPFFRNLWRFNALIIAAVALMALAYGVLIGLFLVRDFVRPRHVASIAPAGTTEHHEKAASQREAPNLSVQNFHPINGHDVMWAPLYSRDTLSATYYSKEATNTRDYLFYEMATGQFRRLIDRDYALASSITFLTKSTNPSKLNAIPGLSSQTTLALLVTYIDKDTNGDGRISTQDRKTVAMAGPTGLGLRIIASDVTEFLGSNIDADGNAVVILSKSPGTVRALKVALPDLTVIREDNFAPSASDKTGN